MVANNKLFYVFTDNFIITEPGGGPENTNHSHRTDQNMLFHNVGFGVVLVLLATWIIDLDAHNML